MGAKVSKEMEEAMRLIRAGDKPGQAAAKAGVARSTVIRSRLFKAWKEQQTQADQQSNQGKEST